MNALHLGRLPNPLKAISKMVMSPHIPRPGMAFESLCPSGAPAKSSQLATLFRGSNFLVCDSLEVLANPKTTGESSSSFRWKHMIGADTLGRGQSWFIVGKKLRREPRSAHLIAIRNTRVLSKE